MAMYSRRDQRSGRLGAGAQTAQGDPQGDATAPVSPSIGGVGSVVPGSRSRGVAGARASGAASLGQRARDAARGFYIQGGPANLYAPYQAAPDVAPTVDTPRAFSNGAPPVAEPPPPVPVQAQARVAPAIQAPASMPPPAAQAPATTAPIAAAPVPRPIVNLDNGSGALGAEGLRPTNTHQLQQPPPAPTPPAATVADVRSDARAGGLGATLTQPPTPQLLTPPDQNGFLSAMRQRGLR